jgi:hypothetical protein
MAVDNSVWPRWDADLICTALSLFRWYLSMGAAFSFAELDTRTMDGSPARPEGCAESTGPSPHAKDRATEVALWRRQSN